MALASLVRIKNRAEISSSNEAHEGLRIVILQISEFDEYSSNTIVVKSGLKSLTRTNITSSSSSSIYSASSSSTNNGDFSCFLTSCHLCKKPLSPDKDVYMYRGDQGFCSKECRSKQIMVDEVKEMDEKRRKKKRVKDNAASSSSSSPIVDCVGCETCSLLQDLRKRRHLRNANKFKPPHVMISSAKHQPLISFS